MKNLRHWKGLVAVTLLVTLVSLQIIHHFSFGRNSGREGSSRQRRFAFFTSERRLAFPIGTFLFIPMFLSLPGIRNLPEGYGAPVTLETALDVSLDALGYTSDENPYFTIPDYTFAEDGGLLYPGISLTGGDRWIMYQNVEDMIASIGLVGQPCLLRAICEVFLVPMGELGFLGELLKLFFSPSRSPNAAKRLSEYVEAERNGKESGTCDLYNDSCPHSLFINVATKEPKLIPVSSGESRKKRFIYLTTEQRLTLPPTTVLIFAPTLQVPVKGGFPTGTGLSFQLSSSIVVNFDDLGLTSEENPIGILPFLDDIPPTTTRRRKGRITRRSDPKYPGGDRDMLYQVVEDTILNTGLPGKACLLRAICEMFQYPLDNHGLFGEVLELFFSASLSPDAERRLPEYLVAERSGRTTGNCSMYLDECPHSLFNNPLDTEMSGNELHNGEPRNKKVGLMENAFDALLSPKHFLVLLLEYAESWL